MTTDILRFARPAQLTLRPVDVCEVIEQAAAEIRPIVGEQIKFEMSAPVSPMYVCADSAQLTQVLINLALNARDSMEASGGTLTVEARPAKDGGVRLRPFALPDCVPSRC